MTMGEWVLLVQTDADASAKVLLEVLPELARQAMRDVRLPLTDAEDVASEATLVILKSPEAAERADPETLLNAWLRGVVKNLARRARHARDLAERVRVPHEPDVERRLAIGRERSAILNAIALQPLEAMTGRQSWGVSIWVEGARFSAIGARLGIGRDVAFRLVERGLDAARHAAAGRARSTRTRYPPVTDSVAARLNLRQRDICRLANSGLSVAAVARSMRMSFGATHSALHRLRVELHLAPA